MAGEIPAALGVRMARPDAGEVYVLIGDGNYLMGATGELVTARQEGLKLTVIVVENHGFQSIHGLQRARTGRSFGLEFRERSADGSGVGGPFVEVDYAANARSLGCAVFTASIARRVPRRARRGPSRDGARGDRRARGAAAAAARLRLLVGRRGGGALRAARDARAGGRACPRPGASAALPPTTVRIVATAEVPPVAREAFARLGEIEVAAAGDGHAIAGAEVLIVRGTRLDAATLARAGRLRAIARTGAGYDNVDVEAATRLGVPVVYAPGIGSRPVAEGTLALILAAAKRLRELGAVVHESGWATRYGVVGLDIEGACLGVVGFGAIGREVARLCFRPRDARDRARSGGRGAELVSLAELAARADVITLHCALTRAHTWTRRQELPGRREARGDLGERLAWRGGSG